MRNWHECEVGLQAVLQDVVEHGGSPRLDGRLHSKAAAAAAAGEEAANQRLTRVQEIPSLMTLLCIVNTSICAEPQRMSTFMLS
jgi:hypothetical protein